MFTEMRNACASPRIPVSYGDRTSQKRRLHEIDMTSGTAWCHKVSAPASR
jgi:hypothetical protein